MPASSPSTTPATAEPACSSLASWRAMRRPRGQSAPPLPAHTMWATGRTASSPSPCSTAGGTPSSRWRSAQQCSLAAAGRRRRCRAQVRPPRRIRLVAAGLVAAGRGVWHVRGFGRWVQVCVDCQPRRGPRRAWSQAGGGPGRVQLVGHVGGGLNGHQGCGPNRRGAWHWRWWWCMRACVCACVYVGVPHACGCPIIEPRVLPRAAVGSVASGQAASLQSS
jgi:hypothetical protein